MSAHAPASASHEPHASVGTYVRVALILVAVTALEVGVIYIRRLTPIIVPLLLVMSIAKFTLVVMFFMHLKYDNRFNATIVVCSLMFIGVFFAYTMNDTERRAEVDDAQGSQVLPTSGQQAPGGYVGAVSAERSHENRGSFYAPNAGEVENLPPEPEEGQPAPAGHAPAGGEVPVEHH